MRRDLMTGMPISDRPLNRLTAECHAANQHWWHDPATGARIDRDPYTLLFLIVSEIVEAGEGERKDLMDSHLPHRKAAEVELADALIRFFDFAGAYGHDLDSAFCWGYGIALRERGAWPLNSICADVLREYSAAPAIDKPPALYRIIRSIIRVGEASRPRDRNRACGEFLFLIFRYAAAHGYDLDGAVAEKRAYNATRADHTVAARLAAGGKKW